MEIKNFIETTKQEYRQIYAYNVPDYKKLKGYIKIGYTTRKDVLDRINEQSHTINVDVNLLWKEPARYLNGRKEYFTDIDFHKYLVRHNVGRMERTEYFYYNGHPEKSYEDFDAFRRGKPYIDPNKQEYILRAEQKEAVEKTLEYATTHPKGKFLWNAKPRFGKTLTAYDFCRQFEARSVLIITNRPSVGNSWYDDFQKFIAWQTDYCFISTSDSLKNKHTYTRNDYLEQLDLPDESRKTSIITFLSLQDLKGAIYFGGKYDKLDWIKKEQWDVLIIDESHEGVATLKTDVALNEIDRKFTLHLSGTPFKAIASMEFKEEQIYNWSYEDEQVAKINWYKNSSSYNPYEALPKLHMLSYQISRMITDEVNQGANINGEQMDYAFDLNEFFAANDKNEFIHKREVEKWLDKLTKNEKYPFSTAELRNELKHTFWVLDRVNSAKALYKMLKNDRVFENYEIVLAAGDGKVDDDQENGKSLDKVREAIKNHDKTITISVGQLTTGVTVPEWTGALILSNMKSPALYMQTAFRVQNPWKYSKNNKCYKKENAYVFDFSPERTLIIYDEFANNLNYRSSDGNGTTEDRKENIRKLLNFFPVIAEDELGKMVNLDANKIMTIPKTIKAQEVVKRGFMCNLLFQNISGIFASESARAILEKLKPVDQGKIYPRQTEEKLDTKNIEVDDQGNTVIDTSLVISTTEANFGEKVYSKSIEAVENVLSKTDNIETKDVKKIVEAIATPYTEVVSNIAKDNGLSKNDTKSIKKDVVAPVAIKIEKIQAQTSIKVNELKNEKAKQIEEAKANNDLKAIEKIKQEYKSKKETIIIEAKNNIIDTVKREKEKIAQASVENVIEKIKSYERREVEEDIRARLRGFTRTIPAFLMAYGNENTTLENFDTTIDDNVFLEVTGITLNAFRELRDKYNFFDPMVFNESCKEFLHKRYELSNYFEDNQQEDIFDYIPNQETNQIFTPRKVVNLMLDKLEEENPGVFTNSKTTFADLYVKSGLYLAEIVKRLYKGLEKEIPNPADRLKHIMENQIYGFAPSEIIYNIAKTYVFGFGDEGKGISTRHLYSVDTIPLAMEANESFEEKCKEFLGDDTKMKFDIVVGNPPYQEKGKGNNNQDSSIYNYFYDLAKNISSRYCLISPARFLSNQGATPKPWNKMMLEDVHLKIEMFAKESRTVFSNDIDIKGGIVILYRDKDKDFGAIETFIPYEELASIYGKVITVTKDNISNMVYSPDSYRFTDKLFEENPNLIGRTDKSHAKAIASSVFSRYPEIFYDEMPKDSDEYIRIFGRQEDARTYKYIKRKYVNNHENLDKWKVILPGANGKGAIGDVLSTPVIGAPAIGHNQTFVSIGKFETELEAVAMYNYLKTKFARVMLGIMKTTHNNQAKSTWSKVPLQDFTPNSDIDWTKSISEIDQQLYKKYNLSQEEINFIEEKVKAME